jgi:mRNA interferase YafQ
MARRSISQFSLNLEKSWMNPVWTTASQVAAPRRRLSRSSTEPRSSTPLAGLSARQSIVATAFKRDYRREKKGRHGHKLDGWLSTVVTMLANDTALPEAYVDHALTGEWKDYRDCHVKPDLALMYRKSDSETLQLVRLGTHAELFK